MDRPRHRSPVVPAGQRARPAGGSPRGWTVLGCVVVGVVVLAVIAVPGSGRRSPAGPANRSGVNTVVAPSPPYAERPLPTQTTARWAGVVRDLDAVRERAWRQGRPAVLGSVYVLGSPLLRRDQAMQAEYADRGLRVAGASLDLDRVRVVARRPGVVRLVMVDELGPLVARAGDGRTRPLPDDRPSRHLLELRREGEKWQIADVWVQ